MSRYVMLSIVNIVVYSTVCELRNINVTYGEFNTSRAVFEDLLYQRTRTETGEEKEIANSEVFLGVCSYTGNRYDVAIKGSGFFTVQLDDGSLAYTRNGSFHLDQYQQLVTERGYQLQPLITIPEHALNLTISRDGTVSVIFEEQMDLQEIGVLTLTTFINENGLEELDHGLYRETATSGSPNDNISPGSNGAGELYQGCLDFSKVTVVQDLINMIKAQRDYEINSKAKSTADQMLKFLESRQ